MPPIRFRIRTVMIAVAALAVLMAMVKTLRGPFFENMIMFTAAVVCLAAGTVVFLVAVIVFLAAGVRDLFAFGVYSCHDRLRQLSFPRHARRRFRRLDPGRSGEPESV